MICVSLCRLFGRYCGRIPAWTLYGSNRTMVVIAHTDDDVTKYGFRAVYQVSYTYPHLKTYWLIIAKNNGHAMDTICLNCEEIITHHAWDMLVGFLKYSYYNFLKTKDN